MNKNRKPKNKRSSEMKHTEGQWVVQNPHYKTGVRVSKKITKGSAGKIHYQYASIADITEGEFDGEQEANANLIASAPEMLEELKKASGYLKTLSQVKLPSKHWYIKRIEKLIARAEGR
jgi:hypothetical protein